MKVSDVFEQLPADRVYGQPYETSEGVTVIPVAKPLGVFVVSQGKACWVPAVDGDRIALIGVLTGLLVAVIASLAVLRQPPWPRMTVTGNR